MENEAQRGRGLCVIVRGLPKRVSASESRKQEGLLPPSLRAGVWGWGSFGGSREVPPASSVGQETLLVVGLTVQHVSASLPASVGPHVGLSWTLPTE